MSEAVMKEENEMHKKIRKLEKNSKLGFIYSNNGNIKQLLTNLEVALYELGYGEHTYFNEFTEKIIIKGELLKNSDLSRIRSEVGRKYEVDFNITDILQALQNISKKNSFHPIKKMIESKNWDGIERVESLFIDYLGANDNHYTRTLTRRWIAGAIGRIYNPGIKFEIVPILQGKQGIGKSTLGLKLAGEFFTDSLKSLGKNKDDYQLLIGKWIVELAELSSLNKTQIEETKNFISAQTDSIRLPYDKITQDYPRTIVFLGTTNQSEYLKDLTGNRRFFPISISKKPVEDIHNINDETVQQIWAEAYHLYKNGEQLFYTESEQKEIDEKYRIHHVEGNVLLERVKEYLDLKVPKQWNTLSIFQKRDIFETGIYYRENEMQSNFKKHSIQKIAAREILEVLDYDLNSNAINSKVKQINMYMDSLEEWENKQVMIGKKSYKGYQRK